MSLFCFITHEFNLKQGMLQEVRVFACKQPCQNLLETSSDLRSRYYCGRDLDDLSGQKQASDASAKPLSDDRARDIRASSMSDVRSGGGAQHVCRCKSQQNLHSKPFRYLFYSTASFMGNQRQEHRTSRMTSSDLHADERIRKQQRHLLMRSCRANTITTESCRSFNVFT